MSRGARRVPALEFESAADASPGFLVGMPVGKVIARALRVGFGEGCFRGRAATAGLPSTPWNPPDLVRLTAGFLHDDETLQQYDENRNSRHRKLKNYLGKSCNEWNVPPSSRQAVVSLDIIVDAGNTACPLSTGSVKGFVARLLFSLYRHEGRLVRTVRILSRLI